MPEFATLLLDPPWKETGAGKIKRGADRHYPLVKTADMPGVIRDSGLWTPAEHAHVWLWVTNNYLKDGLWLLEELGARYVSNVPWVKTADPAEAVEEVFRTFRRGLPRKRAHEPVVPRLIEAIVDALKIQIGIGQYLRGGHELLLFGTIGKGMHESVWNGHRDVRGVIRARRTKHSKKPDASYELIERVSKGPRVEFFARSEREGWESWGNEIAA